MFNFDLRKHERLELFESLLASLEEYYSGTRQLNVSPKLDIDEIVHVARQHDFVEPMPPVEAVRTVVDALRSYIVHTPHPQYYGLFNPRANVAGICADFITAVFNPQMAAWSHSPYAAEVENYLLHELGIKFGYESSCIDGTFCSGGAEANQTAILCALNRTFPEYANAGLRGLNENPVLYCSSQAHHSIVKAARIAGLGMNAVRLIPTSPDLKMDLKVLASQIAKDKQSGLHPFMVVGTAGTTGPGTIDDLFRIAGIAESNNLWFHADAAYGGAVILNDRMKVWLRGIDKAHSITFDVHKWMSVPMAASMFITREKEILHQTFRITADYMPGDARGLQITDPYTHSIQWSRRFIGLKLYLSLLMFGWKGYAEVIARHTHVGNELKRLLQLNGWEVMNDTPLPVVCFTDPEMRHEQAFAAFICDAVVNSGKAWISVYPVNGISTLRACITNYQTTEDDVAFLVSLLNEKREDFKKR